jgi:hypothetical protein
LCLKEKWLMKTQFQGINMQTWWLTWQEKVNDHQHQQICNKNLRTHNCLNYKIVFHFPCSFVLKFIMDKMYILWHHIIIFRSFKKEWSCHSFPPKELQLPQSWTTLSKTPNMCVANNNVNVTNIVNDLVIYNQPRNTQA